MGIIQVLSSAKIQKRDDILPSHPEHRCKFAFKKQEKNTQSNLYGVASLISDYHTQNPVVPTLSIPSSCIRLLRFHEKKL